MRKIAIFNWSPFFLLTVVFAVVTLLSLTALSGLSLVRGFFDNAPSSEQSVTTDYPRLSDNYRQQLEEAKNPQPITDQDNENMSGSPFVDASGVSLLAGGAGKNFTLPNANFQKQSPGFPNSPTIFGVPQTVPTPPIRKPFPTNINPAVVPLPVVKAGTSADELNERLLRRRQAVKNGGTVTPVAEIYSVDDLVPISRVGSGADIRDIRFYAPATDHTFILPVGSRLRDGIFTAVDDRGVILKRNSDQAEFLVKWSRQNISKKTTPTAPPRSRDSTEDAESPLVLDFKPLPNRRSKRQ